MKGNTKIYLHFYLTITSIIILRSSSGAQHNVSRNMGSEGNSNFNSRYGEGMISQLGAPQGFVLIENLTNIMDGTMNNTVMHLLEFFGKGDSDVEKHYFYVSPSVG